MTALPGCEPKDVDRLVTYTCHLADNTETYMRGTASACSNHYGDPIRTHAAEILNSDAENITCSFEESSTKHHHHVHSSSNDTSSNDTSISKTKMARDCGPSYNLRNIIHHNHFSCKYTGDAEINGFMVTDRDRPYKGMLPSCGVGFEASKSLLKDIREYVHDAVDGESSKLDINKWDCTIMGVPPH